MNETKSIEQKVIWIIGKLKNIEKAFKNSKRPGGEVEACETKWLCWEKPEEGWWKLNTDGCVRRGDNKTGGGGVVRDNTGRWTIGFAMNL